MKVKTSSGLKRSQEDKELGSWFGELLPIISSTDNCQPQQAIEPGRKVPETNGEQVNPEESHDDDDDDDDDVCEEEASPQGPPMGHQMEKENLHLHQPNVSC